MTNKELNDFLDRHATLVALQDLVPGDVVISSSFNPRVFGICVELGLVLEVTQRKPTVGPAPIVHVLELLFQGGFRNRSSSVGTYVQILKRHSC